MKVAVVGSRTLDLRLTISPLMHELMKFGRPEILLRKRKSGEIGDFEEVVALGARAMNWPVEFIQPDAGGRKATHARDMIMVERSDAVIAFFDAEHVMEGGTSRVVEKAIADDIPCYAFVVSEDGYEWVGGNEPEVTPARLPAWNRRSGSPTRSSTA